MGRNEYGISGHLHNFAFFSGLHLYTLLNNAFKVRSNRGSSEVGEGGEEKGAI